MPTIQKETTVGAGAVNDNLLSGSAFEYARSNCIVSLGVNASATGCFLTIQSGPDIILEESPPNVNAAGNFPVIPDNFLYNWAANAGDRLVVRFRNPTGGGVVARLVCNITYV